MLKIGKMTDYAMLILSEMAKTPEAILSASALAEAIYLSAPTVSKILKMLHDAKLLLSIRGAEGGYKLARDARDISIVDVLAAMEGGVALTECCENKGMCAIDSMCALRDNWKSINKMMSRLLSGFSVLDMMKPLAVTENVRGIKSHVE